MPCVTYKQHTHRTKVVKGYPCVPLDVLMWETGCSELVTPAYVHKLLDRSEWKNRPEVDHAIQSEKAGLLANNTWNESAIRPKSEVINEAKRLGQKIHIGSLMVIVSIKGYEKPASEY